MTACQLWLTCKDQAEADKIAAALHKKRLVACVRQMPVSSNYRWKGKIESSNEVLLMMESQLENFAKVEAEVGRLHSYESFVLEAVPVNLISEGVKVWLSKELK